MTSNEIHYLPEDPEAAACYWRDRATKLEAEVAELKKALAHKQAHDSGEPVPRIARARRPKPRW